MRVVVRQGFYCTTNNDCRSLEHVVLPIKVIIDTGLLTDHRTNENCPVSEQKILFDRR